MDDYDFQIPPDCHPAWDAFTEWCEEASVNPGGHVDDWGPWWDCFAAGYNARPPRIFQL